MNKRKYEKNNSNYNYNNKAIKLRTNPQRKENLNGTKRE